MHLAVYDSHDDKLENTTLLNGAWFELDNHRVYEEFKVLVLKGPGWSFIKAFDRAKNGRAAVLALRRQCEGTSAVQSRKAAAYAKMIVARYTGHRKTFTFDHYVEAHQATHNTLADLGEAVPEPKKVTDFLAGITDPRLYGAKDLVLGNAQKLQDFEACQQYFKSLVYNKTTQERHERQISGLKQLNKNGKRRGSEEKHTTEVTARTYSREEWSKFSNEQRDKIKELRKRKKAKRDDNSTPRNASAVEQDADRSEASDSDDDVMDMGLDEAEKESEQTGVSPPTRRHGRATAPKKG